MYSLSGDVFTVLSSHLHFISYIYDICFRMLDHWTSSAVRFVKKLLDDSINVYVVGYRNKKEVIYGDLYLELVNGVVNLKEELCKNEFAIISKDTTDQGKSYCQTVFGIRRMEL